MMRSCRLNRRQSSSGFTLIELLLVVALVLMLTSAMVFNFSNLLRGHQLEEGTTRLETLMRFARAQAANSGRKVQLVFDGERTNSPAASTGEVRATWEPDPLRQPGCYSDLIEAQWHVQEINDLVQVESVKLLDASAACPIQGGSEDEVDPESEDSFSIRTLSPITFYPDGSSDSAEIIVSARSVDEANRMAVKLVGMTGSVSHQLLAADWEDPFAEMGTIDRTGRPRRDLTRDNVFRDSALEATQPAPLRNNHPTAKFPRPEPATPRATVGETNRVDQSE